jgi:protein-S-isoprenylcysteine O-methyltransferase Ste14
MGLTAKNIAVNAVYYAVTLVLIPWAFVALDDHLALPRRPSPAIRAVAVAVGLLGAALQVWCVTLFQRVGRGTPSPLLPPSRLVTAGPYRRVRNPMNLGEVMLLIALAGWFASPSLLAYALLAWLAMHVFIVRWEEPRLRARFGEAYEAYRRSVGRWLPRATPPR